MMHLPSIVSNVTDTERLFTGHAAPVGWIVLSVLVLLYLADWLQTITIARHPERWHETNPLMPRHPSVLRVCLHFIVCGLLGLLAVLAAPLMFKPLLMVVFAAMEAYWVRNNHKLGIGLFGPRG